MISLNCVKEMQSDNFGQRIKQPKENQAKANKEGKGKFNKNQQCIWPK